MATPIVNPFAGAFGQDDPEMQNLLRQMMEQQMRQGIVPPQPPQGPPPGTSPYRPELQQGMANLQPDRLTGAQEQQLIDAQNAKVPGMAAIQATKSGDAGTALAKTLAAWGLRKSETKRRKKQGVKLKKALAGDTRLLDELEVEKTADRNQRRDFAKAAEARAVTEHEERNVSRDEQEFRATRPDLAPGSEEFGSEFAKYQEAQSTRYGRYSGSTGGGMTANVQEFEQWNELNPDASIEDK